MLYDILYKGIVYLSTDKFGPVFALVESWVYKEMTGAAYTWKSTVEHKLCCAIFPITETLPQYLKKASFKLMSKASTLP